MYEGDCLEAYTIPLVNRKTLVSNSKGNENFIVSTQVVIETPKLFLDNL